MFMRAEKAPSRKPGATNRSMSVYHKGDEVVLEKYWDCSLKREGDYIVYYNEWGRAVGLYRMFGDVKYENERLEVLQESVQILKSGRK